jgi:hypothetical protein
VIKRVISILVVLLIYPALNAQERSDSLPPLVPAPMMLPRVTPGYGGPEDFNDFHDIRTVDEAIGALNSRYGDNPAFYRNLRDVAHQRYITRLLHELLVVKQVSYKQQITDPRASVDDFESSEGLTIRNISFNTVSLFAPSIDDPLYHSPDRLERMGSILHLNTRRSVIRKNLLFREGDVIEPLLLSDNERIIRQLPYIEDARIYVFKDRLDGDYADVIVVTKDRWSKGFDLDMVEIDEGRIEVFDRNIIGYGHELQAGLIFDGGENNLFGYDTRIKINNIRGRFVNAGISYKNAFSNELLNLEAGRHFLTPSMKYAGGMRFTSARLFDNFTFPDTSFINQSLNYEEYDFWFGRSVLLSSDTKGSRTNLYLTASYNRHVFFERPEIAKNIRHIFHNRNLFLADFTFAQVSYLKSNYIYGFGPTEDIPTGLILKTTAGYENNQFFPRWYSGFSFTGSRYFPRLAYISSTVAYGGFINEGVREQGVFNINSSGFTDLLSLGSFYLRQFFTAGFTSGINRFEDELVTISNRYGIRGLRSNELTGTQKLTFQTETMLYARKNWYGFRYAFYTMADMGWIGQNGRSVFRNSLYTGFGIGVRVRNEHLNFPTLQMRFAYYPRIPEPSSYNLFYLIAERRRQLDDFVIRAPEILPYR